ncbi:MULTISPECIES: ribose utilization transcriptional repressor RbsR [Staphylococcus]|uniref:ribose utilization transcriptional repressor RbsR n=1 Tax=Staphylococcus TaxID=1279 RepID=UPI000951724D|nr:MULTISPECIES: LacI family DNA-binding transcriptional regulator [Staphylococcus]OLS09464.1 LacI family transcriptional regulator [Staphylococcus epidermidis]AXV41178.1 sugar-binding transcriptional regulator, LacI [Staphylococcus sp. M0911]PTI20398.1 LacI family transcriptional regulator [Staphylococcus warneri]PTI24954.1 LacI family transcriptional regulator [Staphylococcus warneri]PTI60951.1 LacI family transcriptional regulator [Staphylococcus warneri]
MKRVSIKDVAKEAGVSVTTVSHILNQNETRFSKETIQKVLLAKDRLGYIPNKNAQQLRGQTRKLIGVVLPNLTNPFFSAMMQRMDDCKADDVDLCFIATSSTDFKDNIQHLVERGIDGLVIGRYVNDPHQLNDYLSKHHVPYVLLDQSEDQGYTDIIRTNEIEGGQTAARHLIDLGHQQLAIIQPHELMANMKDRVKGFEHTCQSHQLPAPVRICTELSKAGGRDIATKLFEHHVTGVFAINDELAIGCIRGLTECGKSVPDDLSVVGYDDIDMAGYMTPALTTIAQSVDDIVHISLQLITDKINGRLHENKRVELPTQLIQRETTRQL